MDSPFHIWLVLSNNDVCGHAVMATKEARAHYAVILSCSIKPLHYAEDIGVFCR